jgi:hypothetical protein
LNKMIISINHVSNFLNKTRKKKMNFRKVIQVMD